MFVKPVSAHIPRSLCSHLSRFGPHHPPHIFLPSEKFSNGFLCSALLYLRCTAHLFFSFVPIGPHPVRFFVVFQVLSLVFIADYPLLDDKITNRVTEHRHIICYKKISTRVRETR
ncbi:hypothetical protein BV25DRAFT_1693092 [Artomyces pyxidatus]|uniref:Uncharacterized protein n=1 Tax=Artomyces pyxidatus TaxID=48021 RepID=A0ACB8TBA6_9AGAM|nr:hypothetical protein BV25DRAFT_1693092 [Artomyces pyxidatus]